MLDVLVDTTGASKHMLVATPVRLGSVANRFRCRAAWRRRMRGVPTAPVLHRRSARSHTARSSLFALFFHERRGVMTHGPRGQAPRPEVRPTPASPRMSRPVATCAECSWTRPLRHRQHVLGAGCRLRIPLGFRARWLHRSGLSTRVSLFGSFAPSTPRDFAWI